MEWLVEMYERKLLGGCNKNGKGSSNWQLSGQYSL